jgi:formylglycine-generating enzyme required for sulfatase activity
MLPRFTLAASAVAAAGAALLAAGGSPAQPAKPAPRLELKSYVEKLNSFKVDENTKQKFEMKAQFEMVYVPGGEVTVGSPESEPGRESNEGPRYKAKVGNFWMGKCEVTWDEFDLFWFDGSFLVANDDRAKDFKADAITRPTNTFVDETYEHGREGHPVMCLTHHAAMMYCHWLRKKTGLPYRLPTEAEWEYAARGGTDTPYAFGDQIFYEKQALFRWSDEDPRGMLASDRDPANVPKDARFALEVGKMQPNRFGLGDMHGNVAEWCLDWYRPGYPDAAQDNPAGPPDGDKRVIRGGSFKSSASETRSAARAAARPTERRDDLGFRIVYAPMVK